MTDKRRRGEVSEDEDRPDANIDLDEYLDLARRSYGWTIGNDGTVCGLVAGDMGYDFSSVQLGALVAVTFGLCRDHQESEEFQRASEALMTLCARLHLRKDGEPFPATLRAQLAAAEKRAEEAERDCESYCDEVKAFPGQLAAALAAKEEAEDIAKAHDARAFFADRRIAALEAGLRAAIQAHEFVCDYLGGDLGSPENEIFVNGLMAKARAMLEEKP